jgi:hypothetical protein
MAQMALLVYCLFLTNTATLSSRQVISSFYTQYITCFSHAIAGLVALRIGRSEWGGTGPSRDELTGRRGVQKRVWSMEGGLLGHHVHGMILLEKKTFRAATPP